MFTPPTFHRPGSLKLLALQVYREWLHNDTACRVAVPALAMEMAANLIRERQYSATDQPPPWLRRVRQRLDDGFAETPGLVELAEIGGVHPTHLARHFRRHYKMSIGEYLRRRRVEAASAMLTHPDISLTEIAFATGFAHHAHFTTTFKRLTGLTPSDFRRLRR